jgi:hypothetical protein
MATARSGTSRSSTPSAWSVCKRDVIDATGATEIDAVAALVALLEAAG